jgi:hypothetical protein
MYFPASAADCQRRSLELVTAMIHPTYTEDADVEHAALHIRCLLATSRLVRDHWPDAGATMENDACARSLKLGTVNPDVGLPEQFLEEPALANAFCCGQQQALPERTPAEPTEVVGDDGPLFVCEIQVRGTVYRDDYDEHPGLAYYSMPDSEDAVVLTLRYGLNELASRLKSLLNGGSDLPTAMRVAEPLLVRLQEFEAARRTRICDGLFISTEIVLIDQHGQLLQMMSSGKWATPVPAEQWQTLLARASQLESEADLEDRWDNFCTARGLRDKAWAIKEIVAVSQRLACAVMDPIPATAGSAS